MATRTETNGLTAIRAIDKYFLGTTQFRDLPLDLLKVDPAYQRDINEKAVQRIVNNFDTNLLEPLTVNERTWKKRTEYAIIDGQHRYRAIKRLGMPTATCRVVSVPREEEGQLFTELNRNRIWLTPVATFKAELDAKNPAAIEIKNCIESRGLEVTSSAAPNGLVAIVAIKRIYAKGGFIATARALDTALLAWTEDQPRRLSGSILLGLDAFFYDTPRADVMTVAEKLARTTPHSLLAQASQRHHSWKGLGNSGKSLVDCVAEEIARVTRKRVVQ